MISAAETLRAVEEGFMALMFNILQHSEILHLVEQ